MGRERKYPKVILSSSEDGSPSLDSTFITNEPGKILNDKVEQLIKKDCRPLQITEKINGDEKK